MGVVEKPLCVRRWRFATQAAILRAGRDPVAVMQYLHELDDEAVTTADTAGCDGTPQQGRWCTILQGLVEAMDFALDFVYGF